jgi:predicted acylesterase/phospholipase RssA
VRRGSWDGIDRLVRVVTGTSVSLVLGGGGARGFAHLGVIRALYEHGIPIDFVGGTSIGASAAAGIALGWDVETGIANAKHVTVDRGSLVDFTIPAVALSKGEAITTGLRDVFGEAQIEDLWYPMFCVSTDLTDGIARVHTSGSVWKAVRSSIAIPGTFPPMRADDGHVLVDGGVVNNLPVDVMEEFARGSTILAVDLRARAHLPAESLSSDGIVSGWGIIGSRLNPVSRGRRVPRIIDILLRSNEVASSPHGADADLVFHPAVDAFGVLDFASWDELIDVGYRHATAMLATPSGRVLFNGTPGQATVAPDRIKA